MKNSKCIYENIYQELILGHFQRRDLLENQIL